MEQKTNTVLMLFVFYCYVGSENESYCDLPIFLTLTVCSLKDLDLLVVKNLFKTREIWRPNARSSIALQSSMKPSDQSVVGAVYIDPASG